MEMLSSRGSIEVWDLGGRRRTQLRAVDGRIILDLEFIDDDEIILAGFRGAVIYWGPFRKLRLMVTAAVEMLHKSQVRAIAAGMRVTIDGASVAFTAPAPGQGYKFSLVQLQKIDNLLTHTTKETINAR